MATPAHSELAFSLTKHYFGEHVASVLRILFNFDQVSLRFLKFNLPELKMTDLKKALLLLVKYQLVDYVKTVKNFSQQYEYSVVPQRVLSFFRMARFVPTVGSRDGLIGRIVINILLERALVSREKLIDLSLNKLKQLEQQTDDPTKSTSQISEFIDKLVSKHYLVLTNNNLCLNIERFNRDYRDDLVVEAINIYYGKESKIKAICRAILDLTVDNTHENAPITAPIPIVELQHALVPEKIADRDMLEKYLGRLTSECNNRFVVNSGLHPIKGPMFAVNIGLVIDYLVKEHLSSVITTRFGPKCCRVFRVLLLKGALLSKQIEEIIMLPAKDVREYSYMLIKEGFIRNRQVPKTPDNAPGKSVFIMSVELDQVVYSVADMCCRSMNNLLIRYDFEMRKNKALLDRSKAVQELLGPAGDAATNQEDWNQYFNSHELSQLNAVNRTLDKIINARIQVDETLFLLHSWSNMAQNFETL